MVLSCLTAGFNIAWAVFYFIIVFPVTVVVYFFKWFFQMLGYGYIFLALLGVFALSFAIARYQPQIQSNVEFAMRCYVYPVVSEVIITILKLIQLAYNPSICWWDIINAFVYTYFTNVLGPAAVSCGAKALLIDLGCILTQFFETLLVFIATGEFLTGYYDMSKLSAAIVQFWDDWFLLLCCLCQDLCCLVKVVPIYLPFLPFPVGLIIPALFPEYQFWQSFESLINFLSAMLQQFWPLIIDLLLLRSPSQRPQFNDASKYLCQVFQRLTTAIENALQRFWDTFIPWRINFQGMLCAVPTFLCITVDGANFVLTMLANIDIVVFNMFTPWPNSYVGPPYTAPVDIWHTSLKDIAVLAFNSFAPVTYLAYRIDLAQYERVSLIDCLCVFIQRLICDHTGGSIPCFNEQTTTTGTTTTGTTPTNPATQNFLMDFNFCCLTNTVIITVNDFAVGIYDMFQHTTSATDWFTWLDSQPHTAILVSNLVNVAQCLFSAVELIPVVGFCFKSFNVELLRFVFSVVGFLLKVIIALVTLVWDFLNQSYSNNFLLQGETAITEWEGIVNILIGMDPGSLLNCLQYILNVGIQIPPITLDNNGQFVTCNPPCVPVDFIPPPTPGRWEGTLDNFDSSLLWEKGYLNEKFTANTKVTPILSYHRSDNSSEPWFHPQFMRERLFAAAANTADGSFLPINKDNIDEFFDKKRDEFYKRHAAIQECRETDLRKEYLRKHDPWRLKYLKANNKLPDTSHCFDIGAYDYVLGHGKPRQEQYRAFISSAEAFGVTSLYNFDEGIVVPSSYTDRFAGRNVSRYMEYAAGYYPEEEEETEKTVGSVVFTPDLYGGVEDSTLAHAIDPELRDLYQLGGDEHDPDSMRDHFKTRPPRIIPPPPPLTTRPTSPPIMGCPAPGQPPNPCFDLACIPRAAIQTIGQILLLVPHILDGLIRGNFPDTAAGEVQWGYFIGNNCTKRCLEKDIINTVTAITSNLVCLCKILTLILPSSPLFPQPDFCCSLTRLSDLITNAIQVTINGIKSLVLDSPQYIYFNQGYFIRDINELFDETLGVTVCLCQLLRYIFPISQLTGGTIENGGGAFDICCIPLALAEIAIETLRFIVLIIVNLATIESYGINFWRTSAMQPDIHLIGFNVQVKRYIEVWFGSPGGVCAGQGKGQGIGGITTCICQLLNLVLPIRSNPGAPVSDNNCPIVNLCCFIVTLGYFLKDFTYFQVVGISAFWQSWAPEDNGRCTPGNCAGFGALPYAFIDYLFCHEITEAQYQACINPNSTTPCQFTPNVVAQQPKCGKLFPIIDEFVSLLSTCPCQFFSLVDAWLAQIFSGFDCFCGPVGGVLTNAGDLVKAVTVALTTLIRRANDITYWQPFGKPGPDNMNIQFSIENTWTFGFFGPIVDAACNTLAASTCFLDIFLPFCQELRKRIVKSVIAYTGHMIILIGAFIEGIVGIFTTNLGAPAPGSTGPLYGQNADAIASLIIAMFSGPMNGLLGDSSIVCSMVNPPLCPEDDKCCCYNSDSDGLGFIFFPQPSGPFSQPGYQCAQCDAINCTSIVDSYAYPTCRTNTSGFRQCFDETSIGELISCDANNPKTTKLDGGLVAIARYFQCALGMLVPAFATIMQGLIILMSILWQLWGVLVHFVTNIIVFIYGIFTGSSFQGGCSIGAPFDFLNFICTPINLVTNFINIFVSAITAFIYGVVLPNQPAFRSVVMSRAMDADGNLDFTKLESRRDFSNRIKQYREILYNDPEATTAADRLTMLFDVIWGYSTDDCMQDFTTCACRNLPLDFNMCILATSGSAKRDMGAPSVPVVNAISDLMKGQTMCDHHIRSCANMTWDSLAHIDKTYYVDCLEKVVQSGRLNEMNEVIPDNYFYSHDGALTLWENLRVKASNALRENTLRMEQLDQEAEQHKVRSGFYERLAENTKRFEDRRKHVKNYAMNHPRWKKSMLTPTLIELDQFEFKMRTGYYRSMFEVAAKNLKEGRLPQLTFKSRMHHLAKTFKHAAKVLYNLPISYALGTVLEGVAAVGDIYSVYKDDKKTVYQLWRDAIDKHNAIPAVAAKEAEKEVKRQKIRDAVYASPLYRWWANPPDDVKARLDKLQSLSSSRPMSREEIIYRNFTAQNPLSRLMAHLKHTYNYHREHWQRHPPNLMTMDKHIRERVSNYLSNKFSLHWTPKILANWRSVSRLYYRAMDRIWPGSVSRDVYERFSIGPYCNVSWDKRSDNIERSADGVNSNCSNATQYMREIQERSYHERQAFAMKGKDERGFIINGNCLLMDGLVDQFVFFVEYCGTEVMPQIPQLKRDQLVKDYKAWRMLDDFAMRGEAKYGSPRNYIPDNIKRTMGENDPYNKEGSWTTWLDWLAYRGANWVRYKADHQELPGVRQRRSFMEHVGKQQWLRATSGGAFSFFQWLLEFIDSILGTNFAMEINMFIRNLEEFLENENEDWYAGPVGLRYWLFFWTRCVIQPRPGQLPANAGLNVNCKVGIGLGPAIAWVTLILLAVYILGSLFLPFILMIFNIIPLILVWLILVPAVGLHYSPRCWLMTPSLLIPGYGSAGISVPYYPFPIALPALPFCLMDEIINLVIQFFPQCWCQAWWGTSLEFLCPPYMVSGNTCPPCPEKMSFLSCVDLGIGDGISVLAYLSQQYFPWFADGVRFIFQTAFFSGEFGPFLGNIGFYVVDKFSQFGSTVTGIQKQRNDWCAGAMSLSLVSLVVIGVPLVTFIAFLWTSFLFGMGAIWALFMAVPLQYMFPGWGGDPYTDSGGTTGGSGGSGGTGDPSQSPYIAVRIEDQLIYGDNDDDDEINRRRRRGPPRRRRRVLAHIENAPVFGFMDHTVRNLMAFFDKLKRD